MVNGGSTGGAPWERNGSFRLRRHYAGIWVTADGQSADLLEEKTIVEAININCRLSLNHCVQRQYRFLLCDNRTRLWMNGNRFPRFSSYADAVDMYSRRALVALSLTTGVQGK